MLRSFSLGEPSLNDAVAEGGQVKFFGLPLNPQAYDAPDLQAAYVSAYHDAMSKGQLEAITPDPNDRRLVSW